jgi:hypothetical protein
VTTFYPRWSPTWDRIGWSTTPQYPGQHPIVRDFPRLCQCGARFVRTTVVLVPHDDGRLYEATCAKGHVTPDQPVRDLVDADFASLIDAMAVTP